MEGTALNRLIHRARTGPSWPLSPGLSAALVRPVLRALVEAHAETPPRLHRDVWAGNVRVDRAGGVWLENFGERRAQGSAMSPEQAHGLLLDERADVYGVGALLFELSCGRPVAASVSALALGELESPRVANPALSAAFVAVLERALKLDPRERFATAGQMLEALDAAVTAAPAGAIVEWEGALPAAPAAKAEPAQVKAAPPKRRRPQVSWTLGAVTVLTLGATIGVLELLEHRQAVARAEYERTLRTCDVLSEPPGAAIYLDGAAYPEHTPAVLKLERDREYMLELRGASATSSLHVKNQKKVNVSLNRARTSETFIENEVWDAPNPHAMATPVGVPAPAATAGLTRIELVPVRPAPAAANAVAEPAGRAEPEPEAEPEHLALDAESAPAQFKLTRTREVIVPETLCHEVGPGTLSVEYDRIPARFVGAGRYVSTDNPEQSLRRQLMGQRALSLLYLSGSPPSIPLVAATFSSELKLKTSQTVCPFLLTDRSLDRLDAAPLFIQDSSGEPLKASLIMVPYENRFLVRSVAPQREWTVTVSPKTPPYAVMTVRLKDGSERAEVLNHDRILPKGSSSVWFTVPVTQPTAIDYDVSVR